MLQIYLVRNFRSVQFDGDKKFNFKYAVLLFLVLL